MRMTLTIDDRLARARRERAHRSGRPFEAVVNETPRNGLTAAETLPQAKSYRLAVYAMGAARRGSDLDKALALGDTLEDEKPARKFPPNE